MKIVHLLTAALVPTTLAVGQQSAEEIERQIQALRQLQAIQQSGMTAQPSAVSLQAAPVALGPKKDGVKRVGLMVPRAQLGQGSNVIDVGEPVRSALAEHLSGPALELVPLGARIAVQAQAEAKQKECDFILDTTVTKVTKGGGLARLMGAAGAAQPMISMIPLANMGGLTRTAAGAVAAVAASATLSTLTSIAATTKAKDEVTLTYKLMGVGQAGSIGGTERLTAGRDGEDVLTPLVAQVSASVAEKILAPVQ